MRAAYLFVQQAVPFGRQAHRAALSPIPVGVTRYCSTHTPKPPTHMSFSLPRVNKNSSDNNKNNNSNNNNLNNNTNTNSNAPSANYDSSSSSSSGSGSGSTSGVYDTLSKATLIGRTGAVAELKELPSGMRVATLRLATNHLSGNSGVETQWHTVQIYDGVTGFSVVSSLPAGTQLYVEGALRVSSYEKDGSVRQFVNVSVSKAMGMFRVLRRPYRAQQQNNSQGQAETEFPF